jgi:hypothetical protein
MPVRRDDDEYDEIERVSLKPNRVFKAKPKG